MTRTSRPVAHAAGPGLLRLALIVAAIACAGCASRAPAPDPAPAPPPAPTVSAAVPAPAVRPPQAATAPGAVPGTPAAAVPAAPPAAPANAAVPLVGPGAPAVAAPPTPDAEALTLEAGLYRCELGRRVVVRRVAPDRQSMVINWRGQDTQLHAVLARTGALRFENPQTGYVWLVIVGKSMLLDARAGRTLANECRL